MTRQARDQHASAPRLAGTGRLADDLYLMAHHETTGRPLLQPRAAGLGLAGALLAELTLAGAIEIAAGRIAIVGPALPEDGLAREVLGRVHGEHAQHPAQTWLAFLARTAPADVARRQIFPLYFRIYVEHALADGIIHTTPSRAAAALWLPAGPDPAAQPPGHAERLAAATSPWTGRFVAFDAALEARHPAGTAHRHLALLAVRPGRQGQGTGTALLRSYHQALDRDGTPAYLEASDLRTRRIYLTHGYADHGPPIRLPGGPLMYPMWRQPVPRPRASAGHADPIPPAGM